MPERPPIQAVGRVVEILEPGRLYRVEMANGYRAYAVIERTGPPPPGGADPTGAMVELEFSPYDMSRCHLVEWLQATAPASLDS